MSDSNLSSNPKFAPVESLLNTMLAVRSVPGNGEWIKINTFGGYLNIENARLLRDWLNQALPEQLSAPAAWSDEDLEEYERVRGLSREDIVRECMESRQRVVRELANRYDVVSEKLEEASEPPSGWQLIDTAPLPKNNNFSCIVAAPMHFKGGGRSVVGEATHIAHLEQWYWAQLDPTDGEPIYPTHWQPLPDAPGATVTKSEMPAAARRDDRGFTQEEWSAMPCASLLHHIDDFHVPGTPCPMALRTSAETSAGTWTCARCSAVNAQYTDCNTCGAPRAAASEPEVHRD